MPTRATAPPIALLRMELGSRPLGRVRSRCAAKSQSRDLRVAYDSLHVRGVARAVRPQAGLLELSLRQQAVGAVARTKTTADDGGRWTGRRRVGHRRTRASAAETEQRYWE